MKAIIIAAGMGKRLGDVTRSTPKCLLTVGGRTILDHQLDAYGQNGVRDVVIVKGHCADQIQVAGATTYVNPDFASTNALTSLMCAEREMDTAFFASYSDIIFDAETVARFSDISADVAIAVERTWRQRYEGRDQHPVSEAEKVVCDDGRHVLAIGKTLPDWASGAVIYGEFIGLMRCSARGGVLFKRHYASARARFGAGRFGRAASMDQAYLTDFLQYLVEQSVRVRCVPIERGWMEIDTPQDLAAAHAWVNGTESLA